MPRDELRRRPTEIAIRSVMPDESPIDLDQHARHIAVVVVSARRRAHSHAVHQHVKLARELLDQAVEAVERTETE